MPLPRVTIRRRINWYDTDASSKYHNTAPFRLMEEAEATLLDELGIVHQVYGWLPRRDARIEYLRPLRFWDEVDVDLEIVDVGRTSVTYAFAVFKGRERCAEGRVAAVYIDEEGKPRPWPPEYRRLLEGEGP
jgi:acyl-CoA thioester hydrolase